jgi:hypothetical protein
MSTKLAYGLLLVALASVADCQITLFSFGKSSGGTGATGGGGGTGGGGVFSATSYGAVCDGMTDDTAHIQAAINAATAAGGGTIDLPSGTCLLNSTNPSDHPWYFYNLIAGSNIKLNGAPTTLLQGSGGKHAVVSGASTVQNTALAFGLHYAAITFQRQATYPLHTTVAGASSVVLSNSGDASHFHAGDYIDIFETTAGDVNPAETEQITSVSGTTINLAYPLARGFPAPVIANVNSTATLNVGISNLTIQAAIPVSATEVFGYTSLNNSYVIDDVAGGGDNFINMNTINGATFTNDTLTSTSAGHAPFLELTERNSRRITWSGCTFLGENIGFGEYGADVTFSNSHFFVYSGSSDDAGVFFGGKNVTFDHNDVHEMNDLNQGSGFAGVVTDYVGPYANYVGNIKITNNTISCKATGDTCLGMYGFDTLATGNTINSTGNAVGIHAEGGTAPSKIIQNNVLSLGTPSIGILVVGAGSQSVTGNTITATSGSIGVYLDTGGSGLAGNTVTPNTISGFTTATAIH